MKGLKEFFGNLFTGGKGANAGNPSLGRAGLGERPRPVPPGPEVAAGHEQPGTEAAYKKGDLIGGKYEVHGLLGRGGFGVVYLAWRPETGECALKTFRDELLADATAREAFRKEALLWVNLEEHPFILAARLVEEFSGRLFVMMDYIAPDDRGRVSLADHLALADGPLDANQVLKWAIQFCLGMEHAQAHGINCHRDIKPANILITGGEYGTFEVSDSGVITQYGQLKISDFGLAAAAEGTWRRTGGPGGSLVTGGPVGGFGLSLFQTEGKQICGTPGYLAPEVYRGEGADIRSDIYSFGLVLWQMTAGSPVPPFVVPYRGNLEGYIREIYEQQMSGRVPRVDGFLGPIIEQCLCPKPADRYGSFGELRGALEPILERKTGKDPGFEVPLVGEKTAADWNKKGVSLSALGRRKEAVSCYDQALAINPRHAYAWYNKGGALAALGRREEAISCYDQALAIDPRLVQAWYNKGGVLAVLGRHEEAISCYDQVLAIKPRDADAWYNKDCSLAALGRQEEAIRCYEKALAIDLRDADAWYNKGTVLANLGRHEEAIRCCDQALAINPRDAYAWYSKGTVLAALGRHEEAIRCCDKALAIDPRNAYAWSNKGIALAALGRHEEAIRCYEKALAIDPRNADAWYNKGIALAALGRHEEAIRCYEKALAVDPRDAVAWYNRAVSEDTLGHGREAVLGYREFINHASGQYTQVVARAVQRLLKLDLGGISDEDIPF